MAIKLSEIKPLEPTQKLENDDLLVISHKDESLNYESQSLKYGQLTGDVDIKVKNTLDNYICTTEYDQTTALGLKLTRFQIVYSDKSTEIENVFILRKIDR